MDQVPLWAWLLGNVGTAILTGGVAAAAVFYTRRSADRATDVTEQTARELEARSLREQRWDNLRWAAALAASDHPGEARMGVSHLRQLAGSVDFDAEQRSFVKASLRAVTETPAAAYREMQQKPQVYSAAASLEVTPEPQEGGGAHGAVPSGE